MTRSQNNIVKKLFWGDGGLLISNNLVTQFSKHAKYAEFGKFEGYEKYAECA